MVALLLTVAAKTAGPTRLGEKKGPGSSEVVVKKKEGKKEEGGGGGGDRLMGRKGKGEE